jgi:cytochrome P460
VQSGLAGLAIPAGTTGIRFPYPGEVSPSRSASATGVTHTSTFGIAYANDIARGPMLSRQPARFPAGSILVRERLLTAPSTSPDVLVVMIKREKSFNPKANDWEFLTVSGDLKKIEKREKEGKCQQCHASAARNDFVFRYPAP